MLVGGGGTLVQQYHRVPAAREMVVGSNALIVLNTAAQFMKNINYYLNRWQTCSSITRHLMRYRAARAVGVSPDHLEDINLIALLFLWNLFPDAFLLLYSTFLLIVLFLPFWCLTTIRWTVSSWLRVLQFSNHECNLGAAWQAEGIWTLMPGTVWISVQLFSRSPFSYNIMIALLWNPKIKYMKMSIIAPNSMGAPLNKQKERTKGCYYY